MEVVDLLRDMTDVRDTFIYEALQRNEHQKQIPQLILCTDTPANTFAIYLPIILRQPIYAQSHVNVL